MPGPDHPSPRRRREDEVADNLDTYVQDVITRLDRVILRLIADADALGKAQQDASSATTEPKEGPPAMLIR